MFTFTPKSKLHVKTKSGQDLGKVLNVEIDTISGKIDKFCISGGVIPRVLDQNLLIDWSQVEDWQEDIIIVSDTVASSVAKARATTNVTGQVAHLKEGSY